MTALRNTLLCSIVFLFLLMVGCCKYCLISRSELSGQEDREDSGFKATEMWAGDIDAVVTSQYGGALKSFSVGGVSPIFEIPSCNNSDLIVSCDSGRQLEVKQIEKYSSARKAMVQVLSELTYPSLKMEKVFRMNRDTADLFINRDIVNVSDSTGIQVDTLQKLTLAKGGFLMVPVNVASRYPSLFMVTDPSGEDITSKVLPGLLKTGNKIFSYTGTDAEYTLSADSTEGWFGYFYKDSLLLVSYSPFYKNEEKKSAVVFKADVTKQGVIVSFGETSRMLSPKGSRLRLYEKITIIELRNQTNSYADIQKALKYLKLNMIIER